MKSSSPISSADGQQAGPVSLASRYSSLIFSIVPSPFERGIWLVLLPFTLFFVIYWNTATQSLKLLTNGLQYWEYLIYSFATEASVFLIGIIVALRFLRSHVLATAFACIYLLSYGINIGMLHHAGVLINPYYLSIVTWDNWMIYITTTIALLIGAFAVTCLLISIIIRRNKASLAKIPLKGLIILLVAAFGVTTLSEKGLLRPTILIGQLFKVFRAAPPAEEAIPATALGQIDAKATDFTTPLQTDQLRYLARNQLWRLCRAVFIQPKVLKLRPTAELQEASAFLKRWNFPLGERHYANLNLKPFRHIIVFCNESLSLDFLSPYNAQLPETLTPFYASSDARETLMRNYWTASLPTQPGVTSMYNSHPNSLMLMKGGPTPSLIKLLKKEGYHTIVLKAGSETFSKDHIAYRRYGFDELIGRETLLKEPALAPYIDSRGVMDRVLFAKMLEYLEKYRDQKLYIHVAGQDTHSPMPRESYGDLEYPPTPAEIEQLPSAEARHLLRAAFRHDFDIRNAIQAIRDKGLLTEEALVVVTADHSYPPGAVLESVPGFRMDTGYHRIPFWLISGQPLPRADVHAQASQLDYAPTIAHLLNLPISEGWWGESIFSDHRPAYLAQTQDSLLYRNNGVSRSVSLTSPADDEELALVELFHTLFMEPETQPASQ